MKVARCKKQTTIGLHRIYHLFLLCYCHTSNVSVLAISLMDLLRVSRGILKDGFPVLMPLFQQRLIIDAIKTEYKIDPECWPVQKGYLAVMSKRCQELTYNEKHF